MRQASRRKYHYIYKITRFDGHYYIGLHSTDDPEDGYFGSGSDLWRSINYHGKEKHSKEILEFLPDRNSLKQRERELIGESWKDDPECLNKVPGGGGGILNPPQKTREKMSTSAKNRPPISETTRGKMRQQRLGRKHTKETIEKIRKSNAQSHIGMTASEETKNKMSQSHRNIRPSEDTKKKMSESATKIQLGKKRGPQTPEHKFRIQEGRRKAKLNRHCPKVLPEISPVSTE